jgi:hypothetical protein
MINKLYVVTESEISPSLLKSLMQIILHIKPPQTWDRDKGFLIINCAAVGGAASRFKEYLVKGIT